MLVDVVCPDGVAEGDLISILHPETSESYDVAIPPGVGPGVSFQVELPDVQQQVAIALPPEPPERRLPSGAPVTTHAQLCEYLLAKHPNARRVKLPFEGQNTVVYVASYADGAADEAAAEGCVECEE